MTFEDFKKFWDEVPSWRDQEGQIIVSGKNWERLEVLTLEQAIENRNLRLEVMKLKQELEEAKRATMFGPRWYYPNV